MAVTDVQPPLDAAEFWRQFVVAFYFDSPGDSIAGELVRFWQEGRGEAAVPALRLQTADGRRFDVTAHQERLKAELVKARPVVGDWLTLTYRADAERAAPGMSPAKLFAVEVVGHAPRPGTAGGPPALTITPPPPGASTADQVLAAITPVLDWLDEEPNHGARATLRQELTRQRLSWRRKDWSLEDARRVQQSLVALKLLPPPT